MVRGYAPLKTLFKQLGATTIHEDSTTYKKSRPPALIEMKVFFHSTFKGGWIYPPLRCPVKCIHVTLSTPDLFAEYYYDFRDNKTLSVKHNGTYSTVRGFTLYELNDTYLYSRNCKNM